jgi:dUTP pyrophosphatase
MTTHPTEWLSARWTGEGKQPQLAHSDDAGFDLAYHGDQPITVYPTQTCNIPTGISIQLPAGTWGMITGRSSTFMKRHLLTPLSVIDNGFRGELFAVVRNIGDEPQEIQPDERIAQLIIMPMTSHLVTWTYGALEDTQRGANGFGSTGR